MVLESGTKLAVTLCPTTAWYDGDSPILSPGALLGAAEPKWLYQVALLGLLKASSGKEFCPLPISKGAGAEMVFSPMPHSLLSPKPQCLHPQGPHGTWSSYCALGSIHRLLNPVPPGVMVWFQHFLRVSWVFHVARL